MSDRYLRPDGKNRFQIRSASLGTLPSKWLDEELNNVLNVLNSFETSATINASEWANVSGQYTYTSGNTFTVAGDLTGKFEALRAIRITDMSDTTATSHIQNSSYNSSTQTTTVVLYDNIVPNEIKSISVGFLSKEATTIPSADIKNKSNNFTVGAEDQVLLVTDTEAVTEMWEDDETGNQDGLLSILAKLPTPSELNGKVVVIKKVAGTHQVIISSQFTHSTSYNDKDELVHNYTYNFQIKGDTEDKNRITLTGNGDCVVLVSNGTSWYELTPEASQEVKGIVRFATEKEMTLTTQEIADGKELSKNLAVSPFTVDKEYLRTDARNNRFSSNFIYKAPNGVAAIVNNALVVYHGLGLNAPDGRDDNGILKTKQFEVASDITIANAEVSTKTKLLFLSEDGNWQEVLASNYFMGYASPKFITADVGATIIWFDFKENKLKLSTDKGSNWTAFKGAGPICEYAGNGTSVNSIVSYAAIGFLTRDNLQNIYQQSLLNVAPNYSSGVTKSAETKYTAECDGWVLASVYASKYSATWTMYIDGSAWTITNDTDSESGGTSVLTPFFLSKGQTYKLAASGSGTKNVNRYEFIPCKGALL